MQRGGGSTRRKFPSSVPLAFSGVGCTLRPSGMKYASLVWVLVTLGFCLSARADMERVNGLAVIVNESVITYQEVRHHIAQQVEVLQRQYLPAQPDVYRQKLGDAIQSGLNQLKERQLILHDFRTAGYNLPESIIEDTIRDRIRQRFGDRATLAKSLKEQGITFETFRQNIREEIIVDALRAKHVVRELIISPQKILDFYEVRKTNYAVGDEIKLRMIVLNKPVNGDPSETRLLAKQILERIEAGAPFEDMAKIYSEGSQRAAGGDWGWSQRSVLDVTLAKVAFGLEKGQRSAVVESGPFCYLMLVEDKRAAHLKPLSEVRESIEKDLLAAERTRLEKSWVSRLEKKSYVRYYVN